MLRPGPSAGQSTGTAPVPTHCGQHKYMKLAAPASKLLIPFLCPFGPRPFFFILLPRSLGSSCLDSIPFFHLLAVFLRLQLPNASPQKKQDRCICDLRLRPEHLGNRSRLTSICIRCRQSKVISQAWTALSEAGIRQYANRKNTPPAATSTAFLFFGAIFLELRYWRREPAGDCDSDSVCCS